LRRFPRCQILQSSKHLCFDTKHSMNDLAQYANEIAARAKEASRKLALVTGRQKSVWLTRSALQIREQAPKLIQANALDLEKAPEYGLTPAAIDRLRLTEAR